MIVLIVVAAEMTADMAVVDMAVGMVVAEESAVGVNIV